MKRRVIYRLNWAIPTSLLIIFALVGCQPPAPTAAPQASTIPVSGSTQAPAASPEPASPAPGSPAPASPAPVSPTVSPGSAATSEPVLYRDDFTNPGTGWDDAKLGDYFVGYHPPESYHIEIDSPNEKVPLIEPTRTSYGDVTLELEVFAAASKTSPNGDYRYGLVLRRAGGQYYAFTISPVSKKWAFLKVSPNGVETLKEGTDDSIHGPDEKDVLRVDAMGSNFLLHINDHYVDPVTDASYAQGEVGLYAESLDNPKIHIHFDTFFIHELKLDLKCNISGDTVNVRSGPGTAFAQIALLNSGDAVDALGISSNQWIKIKLPGSNEPGWVSYSTSYMSCTPSLKLFPSINQ
jgi:SH3 domain-containing protein